MNIEHNGTQYLNFTEEEALAKGVPQSAINEAKKRAISSVVKAECKRRIYAIASAETQMNMSFAVGLISALPESSRTDDQEVTLQASNLALQWIAAMKQTAANLILEGGEFYKENDAWPTPSPEVLALVEQF